MTPKELVLLQAKDEGLWFVAEHATEAYLQDALRKLHAAVEADELGKTLSDILDVMQAASSMGDPVDQKWLDRRIATIRRALGK